jgi:hypothetical protein
MRRIRRVLGAWIVIGCFVLAAPLPASAEAAPASPDTLLYQFTSCTGPEGTPTSFDAVKHPGEAAALHLVDGQSIFVAMRAVDIATGTTLFQTPGFDENDVPTVTCLVVHPVTGTLAAVTGVITPIGRSTA